jgi:N-methylhydantoinase B
MSVPLTVPPPAIDPTTLAVVRARLEQIADEMDTVFERMAFSPVISDAWDRADGIYSPADGTMIVQGARGLPIFVGVMQYAVASVTEWVADVAPGDVFLINDPYLGGTHIMDVKMVRPFYYRGRLFAYLANTGHWPDIGGRVPGGFSAGATDVYQEGLRIPPVRLFRDDELNPDIVAILQANSRIPEDIEGDVHAQATALRAGEYRLTELLDEYGADVVQACIDELAVRAEQQMRSYIRDIPDGTYRFADEMDNDGITDTPLRIEVAVTVAGDRMRIDFTGSSSPCTGPMNSVYSATVSSCAVALKHVFPDVALNSGMFAPLELVVPKSTFLNAEVPRPVAGCAAETSQRIITAVMGCLAQAAPERVPAGSCATINNLSMGGIDADGNPYVMYVFLGGGYGGHRDGDGLTNGCSLMSVARTQSLEIIEQRYPVRFERYAMREGSAGAGQARGGFGVDFEFAFTGKAARVSLLGDQAKNPPRGVAGGRDALPASPWFRLGGERVVLPMVSKGENVELRPGDVVCLSTPGGGYGPPRERPPQLVQRDIAEGYLTRDEAMRDYGLGNATEKAGM